VQGKVELEFDSGQTLWPLERAARSLLANRDAALAKLLDHDA
jgi:hypothetical protein